MKLRALAGSGLLWYDRIGRKDDLSPLLDRVFAADVLLIGSPVYLGDTTSQFHAFVERLQYKKKLSDQTTAFRALNGTVQVLPSCDTLQVKDYSKFNMAGFNEAHKKAHHERQFPKDLEAARKMGAELVRLCGNEG